MIATIIIGVVGLLTTGAAPLLQSRLDSRRERVSWNRDHRADVYAEALHHAQRFDLQMDYLVDPITTQYTTPSPDAAHVDQISAKMRLVASDATLEAWQALLVAEDVLRWNVEQDYPGLGQPGNYDGVSVQDASLVAGRQKLEAFYAATRKEFAD